jgi:hypothetical protein
MAKLSDLVNHFMGFLRYAWKTVAMHTVVFRLKPDPETSGAARRPLPESSPRQTRQVPLSETIVPRAIVPMDVRRCAQSTWFIRVGIFFRI